MSTFGNLIALMGAGVGGYTRGARQAEQDAETKAERDEDRAYRREERAAKRKDRDEATDLKSKLGSAWMTRTVEPMMVRPDTADDRDVGLPGTELNQDGFRVNGMSGQRFADEGAAQAAAAAANAPGAALAREREVYGTRGMTDKVRALDDQQAQRELTTLQAGQAKEAVKRDAMRRGLFQASLKGPKGMASFATENYDDGFVYQPEERPDGSFDLVQVDQSGKPTGSRQSFKSVEEAARFADAYGDPGKYVAAIEAREKKAADAVEVGQKERMVAAREAEVASMGGYRAAQIASPKFNAPPGAGAANKASQFDEKQWDAAAKIEPAFVTFTDDQGGKPVEAPALRLTYLRELNAARARGDVAPNEAAESARTLTLRLKNAAEARVARALEKDPGSKLTPDQAVKQILSEATKRTPQAEAGGK